MIARRLPSCAQLSPTASHQVKPQLAAAGLVKMARQELEDQLMPLTLDLKVLNPPTIADIVLRCVSDFELRDREGNTGGGGFTNLKRILGRPADFAFLVDQLAQTVPTGHAVAACDEGAWALVGALALKLEVPAVLVRRTPKTYFVSYGDDPAIGDGRLAGERLPPGTPTHLIDDLVFSGNTLRSARRGTPTSRSRQQDRVSDPLDLSSRRRTGGTDRSRIHQDHLPAQPGLDSRLGPSHPYRPNRRRCGRDAGTGTRHRAEPMA